MAPSSEWPPLLVAGGPSGRRVQYAALPYRVRRDGEVQIRLITSRETRRWVIPKGWPIKGLTPPKTAARECYEEAGLVGVVSREPIGMYTYEKRLGTRSVLCDVLVFPLKVKRVLQKWPERFQRYGFWFSIETAAAAVQEEDLSELILSFGTIMARRWQEKLAAEAEEQTPKAKTSKVKASEAGQGESREGDTEAEGVRPEGAKEGKAKPAKGAAPKAKESKIKEPKAKEPKAKETKIKEAKTKPKDKDTKARVAKPGDPASGAFKAPGTKAGKEKSASGRGAPAADPEPAPVVEAAAASPAAEPVVDRLGAKKVAAVVARAVKGSRPAKAASPAKMSRPAKKSSPTKVAKAKTALKPSKSVAGKPAPTKALKAAPTAKASPTGKISRQAKPAAANLDDATVRGKKAQNRNASSPKPKRKTKGPDGSS